MATTTITSKGQMTLPKEVRDDLDLHPGDKLDIIKQGSTYVLRPRNVRAKDLYGIFHRPGEQHLSPEEEEKAFAEAVARDDERSRARR